MIIHHLGNELTKADGETVRTTSDVSPGHYDKNKITK